MVCPFLGRAWGKGSRWGGGGLCLRRLGLGVLVHTALPHVLGWVSGVDLPLRHLPRDGSGRETGVCPSSTLETVTSEEAPLFCGLSPDLGWTGGSSLGAGSCGGGDTSSLLLGGAGQAGPQASHSQAPAGKGGHPLCAPANISIGKLILHGVRTP